jgi:hypothetical protein
VGRLMLRGWWAALFGNWVGDDWRCAVSRAGFAVVVRGLRSGCEAPAQGLYNRLVICAFGLPLTLARRREMPLFSAGAGGVKRGCKVFVVKNC